MQRLGWLISVLVCLGMAGSTAAQGGPPAPPLTTAPTPLTAPDPLALAAFGTALALDGDTAIIGSPDPTGGAGAVHILAWDGHAWIEQAEIASPNPASGDVFGRAVAISGDTILVGAPLADVAGRADAGAAYVFTRSGATWSLQATLTASPPAASDRFGWAVALDGNTAAIGAPNRDNSPYADCGAVLIYARDGTAWDETAMVRAPALSNGDQFGIALALDGTRLAVGIYRATGKVITFTRSGAVWNVESTIDPNFSARQNFGAALALEGSTLAVGSPGDAQIIGQDTVIDAGAAYVFTWTDTAWAQQVRLQPQATVWQDAEKRRFGHAIALDGDSLLVGTDAIDALGTASAAFLYTRSEGAWSGEARLAPPDLSGTFGAAVGIAGGRLLVGSPGADLPGAAGAGVVYAYRVTPGVDLALAADHHPPQPVQGQRLTLAFAVTNAGPDRASGIRLDVTLPPAVQFESALVSQGDGCAAVGQGVTCDLGALEPGGEATATITVGLAPDTMGATFTTGASAAAHEPDLDPANNATTHAVTAAPYRVPPGCYPSDGGAVVCTAY